MKYKNQFIRKQTGAGGIADADYSESKGLRIAGYLNTMDYIDSSRDNIKPTAWDKTIKEMGPEGANRLRYLWQHQMMNPIAKFDELYTEDNKLKYVVNVKERVYNEVQYVKEALVLIQEGVVDENSVGFQVLNGYYDDKDDIYYMTECKLFEGSAVTLADNDRSLITEVKDFDRIKSLIDNMQRVLKKGSITDETALSLEARLLELKTALRPSKSEPTPKPLTETEGYKSLLTEINNAKQTFEQWKTK